MYCNGCDGRGWVDSKVIGPTLCPVCKGNGMAKKSEEPDVEQIVYDQDAIWIDMRKGTHDSFDKILGRECSKIKNKNEILVHFLFDRDITPQGNLIFHHLQHSTITGGKVPELSKDEITARNYCTDDEGKIETWNGVPISPEIRDLSIALDAEKRLTYKLDANRKGNPRFCDENMLAFSLISQVREDVCLILKDIEILFRERYQTRIVNLSLHLLA